MALGKYTRVDNRRSSTNYCSTVTIIVFVALCLAGVWMMTSSSVVPVQNSDVPPEVQKNEVRQQKSQSNKSSEDRAQPFEDNPGDLPDDATIRDKETNSSKDEDSTNNEGNPNDLEKTSENATGESHENKSEETNINIKDNTDDDTNSEDGPKTGEGNKETKTEDGYSNSKTLERETDASETDSIKQEGSEQGSAEKNVVLDLDDNTSQVNSVGTNDGDKIKEKVVQDKTSEASTGDTPSDAQASNQDVYPSAAQAELLNETNTQNGSWKSQSVESKNEKEAQQSSESKQQTGYIWKNCNVTAGTDYIPCLDNLQAINGLHSTKHYEHRERHCPAEAPTCLVTLPKGYRQPIRWPKSREKIWYYNVPHTKLAEIKGHQNWVKFDGEYLTFPGGGTQFKHGALHYIDFIQEIAPDIAWGSHSRVVLDVGCGVASFGGYLFDRGVLTMSFAPKDEHEAQVQFALERGIPAMSAVMGTKRLPYPGRVFDIVHCARCRVPWHIEGGKLLLELNRLLRPGGYFVWSATPVYQKLPEDVAIWKAMSESIKSICWELIAKQKDKVNGVGVAIYRKPTSNECYEKRSQSEPPLCLDSDDPNAAWNVPLQACLHKVPVNESERGSQWPENWPARLGKPPYWLTSSQVGVYGKSAPDDFTADYEHWKRVVSKSYLNGMGINWSSVRNVMDMRSVYGGFAAALKDLNLWVMNVISIDAPDTLPIIYERGLFGIYHDWCESFSTYPRSYDLLHADHLFSKIKKRCNFVALVAEVDRILRPEGKLIVRDNVETVDELENMFKSMQWEVRLTYSKDKEGLLCVQKSMWRPEESETLTYAIS